MKKHRINFHFVLLKISKSHQSFQFKMPLAVMAHWALVSAAAVVVGAAVVAAAVVAEAAVVVVVAEAAAVVAVAN